MAGVHQVISSHAALVLQGTSLLLDIHVVVVVAAAAVVMNFINVSGFSNT